jgi:hypothetical protein
MTHSGLDTFDGIPSIPLICTVRCPPKLPAPKILQSYPLCAFPSYPTCPVRTSVVSFNIPLQHSHICRVCQVSNQRRKRNNICESDSRGSACPSEVLVSVDEHVCAVLDSMLLLQLRGKVNRTIVFDQRRVEREGYRYSLASSYQSGNVIELTVVVVARHDELCWRSSMIVPDDCRGGRVKARDLVALRKSSRSGNGRGAELKIGSQNYAGRGSSYALNYKFKSYNSPSLL